ncbi:hypothetical protein GGR54DRAFT_199316 [Hypoxylon sp. NC1633]|nr:hypothetical protein GGR54DRAFT_199316 [Hypoxylon sp. NC1633]
MPFPRPRRRPARSEGSRPHHHAALPQSGVARTGPQYGQAEADQILASSASYSRDPSYPVTPTVTQQNMSTFSPASTAQFSGFVQATPSDSGIGFRPPSSSFLGVDTEPQANRRTRLQSNAMSNSMSFGEQVYNDDHNQRFDDSTYFGGSIEPHHLNEFRSGDFIPIPQQQAASSQDSRFTGPNQATLDDILLLILQGWKVDDYFSRVRLTRKDGTTVLGRAKATRSFNNSFITWGEATRLNLPIVPLPKKRRKQYLTPLGRQVPVGFADIDIESMPGGTHRTPVTVLVLPDIDDSPTFIILGRKFAGKALKTKMKHDDQLNNTVVPSNMSNSVHPRSTMGIPNEHPQTSLPADHPDHAVFEFGLRSNTAAYSRQFPNAYQPPTGVASIPSQEYAIVDTMAPGASSFTSPLASGPFSRPSATTGITAPSQTGEEFSPFSQQNYGPSGSSHRPNDGTIDPSLLTYERGL